VAKEIKKKGGFTLFELLVVIAVIGILSSFILVSVSSSRAKARDAKRESNLREINLAMEMCYTEVNCGGGVSSYIDTGNCATPPCPNEVTTIGDYLLQVACDPSDQECTSSSSGDQVYKWAGGGTNKKYCLFTKKEAEPDIWICASQKGVSTKKFTSPSTPNINDCCF
jgi:prepilin-type N-terminal cleavage/methylation domain-containing protein